MNDSNRENRWVCPSDRVLTLRAKLMSGWSVRSAIATNPPTPAPTLTPTSATAVQPGLDSASMTVTANPVIHCQISEIEQESIRNVIARAQQTEQVERERITRLVDRLNNIKRNAAGDGKTRCALCNEKYNMFGQGHYRCRDCTKAVCSKCAVDSLTAESNEVVWLCKICSETREMWKKSGAWFIGSLPHFVQTPASSPSTTTRQSPSTSLSNSTTISPTSVDSQPFTQNEKISKTQSEKISKTQNEKISKIQNSQRILSVSPVMRRKSKTQSVQQRQGHQGHRNATFPYTDTDEFVPTIQLKENCYSDNWNYSNIH